MGRYERIKQLCKKNGLTITGIERELGFARGSLCKIDTNEPSSDRVERLAKRLNTSSAYILRGEDSDGLNVRDRRDIAKDLDDIMEKLESGDEGPLRYNGEQIDDETLIKVRAALEFGLTQLKKENKVLYNPNKNKKQD